MREFTLDDLKRILRSGAGVDEAVDLDGDVLDIEFAELGYDSLAILEFAGRVQREFGVVMPDDAPQFMATPSAAIEYINARLTESQSEVV